MNIKMLKYILLIFSAIICLMIFSFFFFYKNKNIAPSGIWIPLLTEDTLSFYNSGHDVNISFSLFTDNLSSKNEKPVIIPDSYLPATPFFSFNINSDDAFSQIASVSNEGLAIQLKNGFGTALMLNFEIKNSKIHEIDTVSKIIKLNQNKINIHYTGNITNSGEKFVISILPDQEEYLFTQPYTTLEEVISEIDLNLQQIKANSLFAAGRIPLSDDFPDIYWLASDVDVEEENFVFIKRNNINYLNPDFFRVFFQSFDNNYFSAGIFLEKTLQKLNRKEDFYFPLSAFTASNIYRKTEKEEFIRKIFPGLVEMNRKWDELIMSEISGKESGNDQVKFNNNVKIFGLPSCFYISLHIKDCQELLYLAQISSQSEYLNEFRNRILKYTTYINENQALLWETEHLTELAKAENMMPYYELYLDDENKQQFQRSVSEKLTKTDHESIEDYYQIISLLLTYYSLVYESSGS